VTTPIVTSPGPRHITEPAGPYKLYDLLRISDHLSSGADPKRGK
jgi:hypothetical protein